MSAKIKIYVCNPLTLESMGRGATEADVEEYSPEWDKALQSAIEEIAPEGAEVILTNVGEEILYGPHENGLWMVHNMRDGGIFIDGDIEDEEAWKLEREIHFAAEQAWELFW